MHENPRSRAHALALECHSCGAMVLAAFVLVASSACELIVGDESRTVAGDDGGSSVDAARPPAPDVDAASVVSPAPDGGQFVASDSGSHVQDTGAPPPPVDSGPPPRDAAAPPPVDAAPPPPTCPPPNAPPGTLCCGDVACIGEACQHCDDCRAKACKSNEYCCADVNGGGHYKGARCSATPSCGGGGGGGDNGGG